MWMQKEKKNKNTNKLFSATCFIDFYCSFISDQKVWFINMLNNMMLALDIANRLEVKKIMFYTLGNHEM